MRISKKFHIAAVSLIEIMMIFTIISIVTGACVSLNKPKEEYMKKIKLYSAFVNLEDAAGIIAKEGHFDFSTDIGACNNRNAGTHICQDYFGTGNIFKMFSANLPKVANRPTETGLEDSVTTDIGLVGTEYAALTATQQQQVLYLQSGLCQRLSRIMNIPETGINCTHGAVFAGTTTPIFRTSNPHLYLPNGMVLYISRFPLFFSGQHTRELTPTNYDGEDYMLNADCGIHLTAFQNCFEISASSSSQCQLVPYETRRRSIERYENCYATIHGTAPDNNKYRYIRDIFTQKNTDYFIIYVDINGKMTDANDISKGPDQLNIDVYPFKMYRDGSVLPAYEMGFPKSLITAKLLFRDNGDMKYKYVTGSNITYSTQPIGFSRCYANITRIYSTFSAGIDSTGTCYANRQPLNFCIDEHGNPTCKSIINKPSFFIR